MVAYKKNPLYLSVLLVLVVVLVSFFLFYFNINRLGLLFRTENLGVKLIEKIIDSNQNFWLEYKTQTISLRYPMYLSPFNDISATEMTTKDEIVANYFRQNDDIDGRYTNETGRSYRITLMFKDPYFKTQNLDVQKWIKDNKLNLKNPDCTDCTDEEEISIEKIKLDDRDAYSVSWINKDSNLPGLQKIYFQTKDGIASIGFWSWSNPETNDYEVFKKVLSSFKILD